MSDAGAPARTLYFAYGSNMDPRQMAERCPDARALGAARLCDHRLVFVWDSPGWGGGVGHVERAQGDDVWGVLWELPAADERRLDDYEGVAQGVYSKHRVRVDHAGLAADALIYLATDPRPKPPSKRYLDALLRGAVANGLPPPYVDRLRRVLA